MSGGHGQVSNPNIVAEAGDTKGEAYAESAQLSLQTFSN